MAVWVEELTEDSFKICLREVKIFDGLHKGITIVSRDKILFLRRPFLATHILYCIQNLPEYLQINSRTNQSHTFLVLQYHSSQLFLY